MSDAAWAEHDWQSLVDALVGRGTAEDGHRLLALLEESHPAFRGKSSGAVTRMRGWAMLASARFPALAEQSLPLVLEELESGRDAYLIAMAATVLPQIAQPSGQFASLLRRALAASLVHDARVDLASYGGLAEDFDAPCASELVARTLAWVDTGAARSTAGSGAKPAAGVSSHRERLEPRPMVGDDAIVEDQDGIRNSWRDTTTGRPTLVVFFYTRCDNPDKCSSTIERVARVQARLRELGLTEHVGTLAVTYDPSFDGPVRLRGYAASRGVTFGATHRVVRVMEGHDQVARALGLGVNFASSLVNRHRIEAFVLDARGRVAVAYRRLKWAVDEVVGDLERLRLEAMADARGGEPQAATVVARGLPTSLATALAVALALFPKCPLCGAAYLSAAGLMTVPLMPGPFWAWPLLAAGILVNVFVAVSMARRSNLGVGLWLSLAGATVVIAAHASVDIPTAVVWTGVSIMAAGSLLNVFRLQA